MERKQLWPGWNTIRLIGGGGYGTVYEIQKEDDAAGLFSSALKVISIPTSQDEYNMYVGNGYDEESITQIFEGQVNDVVSEFKLMSEFKGTSHIVSYEDHKIVPHEDGHGWNILIRMELLTSLPEYYNLHGFSEKRVIQLGRDICHALELCSQKNIVHRDIKPQNLFVNQFEDFKLGDFGIAKTIDHTTKAGRIGTESYMSPEVYFGNPYNGRADIYSLGMVMYWLLNERRPPFEPLPPSIPTAREIEEAKLKRLKGAPLPPPRVGSPFLHTIILKACAHDPANRYESAEKMRQQLENSMNHTVRLFGQNWNIIGQNQDVAGNAVDFPENQIQNSGNDSIPQREPDADLTEAQNADFVPTFDEEHTQSVTPAIIRIRFFGADGTVLSEQKCFTGDIVHTPPDPIRTSDLNKRYRFLK